MISVAQQQPAEPVPLFGTTVVIPQGFRGDIYFLGHSPLAKAIEKKRIKGTIYTTRLAVPPQDFRQGFPGVAKRLEWFAINYTARIYVSDPGTYRFRLMSDDGSYLYLDNTMIIDDGGVHPPQTRDGSVCLGSGLHEIRVLYFQGPKYLVALVLDVAGPADQQFQIFDTNSFKPPQTDPAQWPKPQRGPCATAGR